MIITMDDDWVVDLDNFIDCYYFDLCCNQDSFYSSD